MKKQHRSRVEHKGLHRKRLWVAGSLIVATIAVVVAFYRHSPAVQAEKPDGTSSQTPVDDAAHQASPSESSPSAMERVAFEPTVPNSGPPPKHLPHGMVWIPGGEFSMGAQDPPGMDDVGMKATLDSRPVHRVFVDGFLMDKTDVTNAEFEAFVKATGYITVAERKPRAEDYPGAPPENLVAGSVVFSPPDHPVPLNNHFQWWISPRGNLASSSRTKKQQYRERRLSGGPDRVRRCRGLREVGRQTPPYRGRMGICGSRRAYRQAVCLGRRIPSAWEIYGQHLRRAFSR